MVMDVEALRKMEVPQRDRLLAAARDYLVANGVSRAVIECELHKGLSVVMVLRQSEPLEVKAPDHAGL